MPWLQISTSNLNDRFCKRYENVFAKILFNILLSCNRNLDLAELSCNSVIMDIAQISKSALLFWEGDTCYRQVSPSVLQAVIASRKCLHLYILFFSFKISSTFSSVFKRSSSE